jgi:hypothetical protein
MPNTDRLTTLASLLGRPQRGIELVDPIDLYGAWMVAEADSTLALAAWRDAPKPDKPAAFELYVESLDREGRAAELLEHRLLQNAA